MGRPRLPDRVISVKPKADRWVVRYVQHGRRYDVWRDDEEQAREFAREKDQEIGLSPQPVSDELEPPKRGPGRPRKAAPRTIALPAELEGIDGTSARDWLRIIHWAAAHVITRPKDPDARSLAKALSSLALAAQRFVDTAELERELKELRTLTSDILGHQRDNTRVGNLPTLPGEVRPS